ncbi:MAG: CHASE2 domain-containing protein [Casimicrobiaceae bacterium]
MGTTPATGGSVPRRVYLVATAILVAFTGLIWVEPPWHEPLQAAWFDTYQIISPRSIVQTPAIVVEIDDKSVKALGQWPWPRTQLADLIDAIARQRPAAIGVDILMSEIDPLSPERLMERARKLAPALASELATQPSNDSELARALATAPSVVAIVGTQESTRRPLRAAPFSIADLAGKPAAATDEVVALSRFADVLTSRDEIDGAAKGHGLISVEPAGGVIRSIPLVGNIHGTLVPALSIEMLRVAKNVSQLRLLASGTTARGIEIGDYRVPIAADGSVRIYYSRFSPLRVVSAVDVLAGRIDADHLQSKLVLIGVSVLGLQELQNTSLGERMPGVEIHAQLLENLFDNTLLSRPTWGRALESATFILLGALLIYATPRWRPRNSALLALGCLALMAGLGFLVFRTEHLLLDAAVPGLALTTLFAVLLLLTLAESTRQRKSLEHVVQEQREHSARMAGELEAAQRIQIASLPDTSTLQGDPRVELAAVMVPAREVGGDLYDFFRLDARRLFILVGDVAGKGLSASIFMAVSKALYKSAMLRDLSADIGEIMSAANGEISRDNPEMLFVTVFAGILDLESGDLDYCNAGHENPFLVERGHASVRRLEDGGGPPLCTVDGFAYRGASERLHPGELLCVVTDGVTEARSVQGAMYGDARLRATLLRAAGTTAAIDKVLAAVRTELTAFAAGAEAADDYTLFLLRWHGTRALDKAA